MSERGLFIGGVGGMFLVRIIQNLYGELLNVWIRSSCCPCQAEFVAAKVTSINKEDFIAAICGIYYLDRASLAFFTIVIENSVIPCSYINILRR